MYYLRTQAEFDGVHFLKDYDGKCANLHGHRWRVLVEVQSESLQSTPHSSGMVLDFTDLKRDLRAACDEFDHAFMYERGTLKESTITALRGEGFDIIEIDFRPTAENLARHFFDVLDARGYDVHRIEVYETPGNCAVYER